MPNLTQEEWIVIGVIFLAGLIIGFLLKPSGAKWREFYKAEHDAHARLRADYDRLRAASPATQVEHQTLRTGSF